MTSMTKQIWRIIGLGRRQGAIGSFYPVTTSIQSACKPTMEQSMDALHAAGYEVNYIASMGE